MGTALAFFLFYEGSYLFFAYCHPLFCTFEIQAFGHQKTAQPRGFLSEYLFYIHRMARQKGFEPSARGFGVDVEKALEDIRRSVFRAVELFVFPEHNPHRFLMLY